MSTAPRHLRRRQAAATPHLRVVRKGRRRAGRGRGTSVFVTGGIIAVALVFGVLLEQVILAQSAFRLSAIRERLATAERRYENLMHEAVILDNPARIERVARRRLGMIEPDPAARRFVVANVRSGSAGVRAAMPGEGEAVPGIAAPEVEAGGTP
ncbi:MAG TPA: hypothetical protein VM573_00745 [Actinomycetota bacterium]|nr:hypothetical protein [Actinomycetota bacterium]